MLGTHGDTQTRMGVKITPRRGMENGEAPLSPVPCGCHLGVSDFSFALPKVCPYIIIILSTGCS